MHFIGFPYQVAGDYEAPNPPSVNGIMAMSEAMNTLVFQKDQGKKPRVWGKAFSLMVLVHVLGDLHQPLHTVSLFSEEFVPPDGDMGGNRWRVNYVSDAPDKKAYDQMHLLFDCLGGVWSCDYMPALVSKDFEAEMQLRADQLEKQFPIEDFKAELDFSFETEAEFTQIAMGFARESFELAKTAYDTYPLDGDIDQDQIKWARTMLLKRVALAGYRMAKVLSMVDTTQHNAPEWNDIPPWWRIVCIAALVVAVVALVAMVVAYRKYKDYKQLAPQTASVNGPEYQSLMSQ